MRRFCLQTVVFLFASYSTALGQNPSQAYQLVEGTLRFYPSRTYRVQAQVQLRHGLGEDAKVYKQKLTETKKPFRFRITVDPDIHLEDLYVKICVEVPKGYYCALRNLRACEGERLKDIPIRRKGDLSYLASLDVKAAIDSGNIDEAKSKLAEVRWWATSPSQVLVPCLDVADFLSKYKSERGNVVKVLTDVEDWVGHAPIGVQKRYWRLRRDATMRLAGYNDFKKIPVVEFAESIGEIKNLAAAKAWTDFTISFAGSYEENEDQWAEVTGKKLTKDKLNSLWVKYPQKREVLGQLKAMEPVVGPTAVGCVFGF